MSVYPYVLVLRWKKYNYLDFAFSQACKFTYKITDSLEDIKLLYNEHWNVLLTLGDVWNEYPIQQYLYGKCFEKWLHFTMPDLNIETLNSRVMACYVANLPKRIKFRPQVSAFTTSFKSGDKIQRPYRSLLAQTNPDWEWVIIDDTDGDDNWNNLKKLQDPRIRIYKRNGNSGSIGNVKNEASSLCRGKYLLELDHDDDILPDCCASLIKGFEYDSEVGFVYMDFAELFEDWSNFKYGEGWAYGFGSYYRQLVNGKWLYAAISCPINNMTSSHITGVPNHPRAWRKEFLDKYGYSEAMPVADDYELLLLTILNTKILKIPKLAYLQYKNNGNNNFSLIRNGEINKLQAAVSNFYSQDINKFFKNKTSAGLPIWKRTNYKDTKVNLVVNFDFDKTVLVKSLDGLKNIKEYYSDTRCDIILVLSFEPGQEQELEATIQNALGTTRIKYHMLEKASDVEILQYFHTCFKTTKEFVIV